MTIQCGLVRGNKMDFEGCLATILGCGAVLFFYTLYTAIFGFILWLVWNSVLAPVFQIAQTEYWQACLMGFFLSLLFGGSRKK